MGTRRLVLPILALTAAAMAPALRAAEVPRQSPELAIGQIGGKPLTLSQYRGKVVVLAFILTTCPHCQKTIGLLGAAQHELGPRGLQVLAAAVEADAEMKVPGFVQQFHPPFPVGYSTDSKAVLGYMQHDVKFIPHMPMLAFIDRQGVIRAQYEGDDPFFADDKQEQNIRAKIEELLKMPDARKGSAKKSGPAPKKTS